MASLEIQLLPSNLVHTLPANQGKVKAVREKFGKIDSNPAALAERAKVRAKYINETATAEGDSNFSKLGAADGQFIDLAIHKDTFLDDAAITTDVQASTALYWKSRYEPVVGLNSGSVYGGGQATTYQTQDNYATLTPFVIDTEEVKVPKLALTQEVDALGQRDAALRRQAEALKINLETFLANVIL